MRTDRPRRRVLPLGMLLALMLMPPALPAQEAPALTPEQIARKVWGLRQYKYLHGMVLLETPEVAAELGLSPEQIDAIATLNRTTLRARYERTQAMQKLPREQQLAARMADSEAYTDAVRTGLAPILRPEQSKRFDQIMVHRIGIDAWWLPEVQDPLRLTDAQQQAFRRVQAEYQTQFRQLMQLRGPAARGVAATGDAYRKQAVEAMVETLAPEQKAAWNEVAGAYFAYPASLDLKLKLDLLNNPPKPPPMPQP